MGVIWTSRTRTKQPAAAPRINWANPLARDLRVVVTPSGGVNNLVTPTNQTSLAPEGIYHGQRALVWNKSGTYARLNTGVMIPTTTNHSFVALLTNTWGATSGTMGTLLSNRNGANNGFAVYLSAQNSLPNQTVRLNYVHGGIVDYFDISPYISNVNTKFVTLGFSAVQGSSVRSFAEGAFVQSKAIGTMSGNTIDPLVIGTDFGTAHGDFASPLILWWRRALSDDEMVSVQRNPWQLFAPERRPVFFSLPSGANTTGTLSSTLDAATLTGVGGVARSGTLVTTLDAATLAGVGNVTRSGTLAITLDAATLSGTGAVTTSGTLAVTLDDVTLAGVGSVAVGTNRDGTLAVTLDAATLAGVGGVTRSGTLAVTLDAATLAGVGTAGQAVTGTLGVTLGNVTLAGIGAIPAAPSAGGGKTFGSNKKKKKQRKAIESEEWLKAEETAKQLLQDRFTKTTPEAKLEALASHIESLQPVIEALKALAKEDVQEAVQETKTEELTEHQLVLNRFDALEKKIESVEELLIILMADL